MMKNGSGLKIAFMGGNQAGILGAMTAMAAGNEIIAAVSYSDNLTVMLQALGIKLFKSIKDEGFVAELKDADLILSVHGREIVRSSSFMLPRFHAVNVHPFLYKYKGADPVARAIKDGELKASVGAHIMTDKVDEGKVLVEQFMELEPGLIVEQAYNRLYPLYASVVLKALEIVGEKKYGK